MLLILENVLAAGGKVRNKEGTNYVQEEIYSEEDVDVLFRLEQGDDTVVSNVAKKVTKYFPRPSVIGQR